MSFSMLYIQKNFGPLSLDFRMIQGRFLVKFSHDLFLDESCLAAACCAVTKLNSSKKHTFRRVESSCSAEARLHLSKKLAMTNFDQELPVRFRSCDKYHAMASKRADTKSWSSYLCLRGFNLRHIYIVIFKKPGLLFNWGYFPSRINWKSTSMFNEFMFKTRVRFF